MWVWRFGGKTVTGKMNVFWLIYYSALFVQHKSHKIFPWKGIRTSMVIIWLVVWMRTEETVCFSRPGLQKPFSLIYWLLQYESNTLSGISQVTILLYTSNPFPKISIEMKAQHLLSEFRDFVVFLRPAGHIIGRHMGQVRNNKTLMKYTTQKYK